MPWCLVSAPASGCRIVAAGLLGDAGAALGSVSAETQEDRQHLRGLQAESGAPKQAGPSRHCLIGVIVDDSSTGGQIPGEN